MYNTYRVAYDPVAKSQKHCSRMKGVMVVPNLQISPCILLFHCVYFFALTLLATTNFICIADMIPQILVMQVRPQTFCSQFFLHRDKTFGCFIPHFYCRLVCTAVV